MYAIYAYIGVVSGVNVGKYGIHGVFGFGNYITWLWEFEGIGSCLLPGGRLVVPATLLVDGLDIQWKDVGSAAKGFGNPASLQLPVVGNPHLRSFRMTSK